MKDTIVEMLVTLRDGHLGHIDVIPWACPVPSFGDYTRAQVATVGLNPSNNEFVDSRGQELRGRSRRFETLNSLGLSSWDLAGDEHVEKIAQACKNYFHGNPYNTWFMKLERLLGGSASYYESLFPLACHLDLAPFSTWTKWGELPSEMRRSLLTFGTEFLAKILQESEISILVLNGESVVRQIGAITNANLKSTEVGSWSLRRAGRADIRGIAYTGFIDAIAKKPIGRKIAVFGMNHNIQSSYGMTTLVITEITRWISEEVSRAL